MPNDITDTIGPTLTDPIRRTVRIRQDIALLGLIGCVAVLTILALVLLFSAVDNTPVLYYLDRSK